MMNGLVKHLGAALGLLLAGCSPQASAPPPLEGARLGGPFTLTSESGARVADTAFAGQYRLIYFGYTFCPDVCPVDVGRLMEGLKRFEAKDPARAAKIQPLFISIDPARDNAAALKIFTDAFHPRLIGLTGSEAEIEGVKKAYGVFAEKDQAGTKTSYTVSHSSTSLLFGPKGEPITPLSPDKGPDAVAAELDQWVK
jgi:protein SCO1